MGYLGSDGDTLFCRVEAGKNRLCVWVGFRAVISVRNVGAIFFAVWENYFTS